MKKFFRLLGIFGNKKKSSKPLPAVSDTARSVAYGNVIEILCSGGNYGIEGLLTPNIKESVYLDETPLSRDGIDFFQGITVVERKGTPFQTVLEGFNSELISENSVGAEVKPGLPLTRSFVNESVTAVGIRVSVVINKNRLDNGQVVQVIGDSIQFKIYIKEGNGAFIERANITINGKFSEPFEKYYSFPINVAQTEDEFTVRLERVTPADSENEKRILKWESYSEIVEELLPFKRMAVVGIRFDTEEFGSSFPERRYHIGGMLLDIPTNATEQSDRGLSYTGNWNGLFKPSTKAVADTFAVLWYLLTDEIDGVGDEIEASMIDRFSLYEISKYNNELIPDGKGGYERRHLCKPILNKRGDAWRIIDDILSACNARKYWENGILKFTQDKPERIFTIVSNADIEGSFDYSSTEIDERATAVYITWTDLENFGKTRSEYVSDPTLISKNGYIVKELECVGCTRRSQAQRFGRSIIYSENQETEIVTFKARQRFSILPIGKVLAIADFHKSGDRLGGLVVSATTNSVTIDFPVTITSPTGFDELFYLILYPDVRETIRVGTYASAWEHYAAVGVVEGRSANGYLLLVQLPNQTVEVKRLINAPGSYTTLTFDGAFSLTPNKYASWALFTPQYKHKLWRVLSKEPDQENIDLITITCTEYSEFKWEKIERRVSIDDDQNTETISSITPPTDLKVSHFKQGNYVHLEVTWKPPANSIVKRYIFAYRYAGSWKEEETITNTFTISNTTTGFYKFRVAAVSYTDLVSEYLYTPEIYISFSNTVSIEGNRFYSTFTGGL